jgi:hypothetical protein
MSKLSFHVIVQEILTDLQGMTPNPEQKQAITMLLSLLSWW